jgi:hypothetical protein
MIFRSWRSKQFRNLFDALLADVQQQARAAYALFTQNPRHPSLHFKRISSSDPRAYSVRIGSQYRAIGLLAGDTVTWIWIGTFEAYKYSNRSCRGAWRKSCG